VGPAGGAFLLTRGADELIYPLPHFRLERATVDAGVPIGPWRGVGPSQNGWVVESFVDELAHAAGKDPYAYRRELVAGQPRLLGVLDLAAQRAGWGSAPPPPTGRARGIALWQFGETLLAHVAEVSVGSDGAVRVHRRAVWERRGCRRSRRRSATPSSPGRGNGCGRCRSGGWRSRSFAPSALRMTGSLARRHIQPMFRDEDLAEALADRYRLERPLG